MTEHHPINPPTELVQELRCRLREAPDSGAGAIIVWSKALARVAQWGADQELEACCKWVSEYAPRWPDGTRTEDELRDARRPKPPSLKQQALLQLDTLNADLAMHGRGCDLSQIRRALETLPND